MKLIFMGTPEFALPSLELIRKGRHDLAAVVTRPDRPRGRGKKLLYPPVKQWALGHGLTIFQPERINDHLFLERIRDLAPDLIVTVAYGCILPEKLLQMPPLGCINLHASLLPAYRGAAPIHRAVIDGAAETGVSVIQMVPELDAGDIILQQKEPIYSTDTAGTLHDRLAQVGAKLLLRAMEDLAHGTASFTPQGLEGAGYAAQLQPGEEKLNWRRGAPDLHNQVRGMNPWPGAYTTFAGKRLKVWRTEPFLSTCSTFSVPGTVLEVDDQVMTVSAGEGILALLEVQPQGSRPMPAGDFCRGYRIVPGSVLGE